MKHLFLPAVMSCISWLVATFRNIKVKYGCAPKSVYLAPFVLNVE